MKINTLFTNLMSNSINKRTPTNNPREGETLNEKTTHSSSTTAASSPLNEASTEQQRLFILRMLANKKINIEEAQGLLDALEGEPELICEADYI